MPVINEIRKPQELGYKGHANRIWVRCEMCNEPRWVICVRGEPITMICNHCFLKTRSGEDSHNWKGGKFRTLDGYIRVLSPHNPNSDKKGYILEHRLIMERQLGRPLTSSEVVHHLNGIKDDNRPENLAVASKKNHSPLSILEPYQLRIKELERLIEAENDR